MHYISVNLLKNVHCEERYKNEAENSECGYEQHKSVLTAFK